MIRCCPCNWAIPFCSRARIILATSALHYLLLSRHHIFLWMLSRLKITGKRDNRSPDDLTLDMLGTSLHTNSVFSHSDATRRLETLQHSDEVVRSEQQQLRNWQGCWSLAKVRVAFCREQCLTCRLPLNCPCVLVIILFVYLNVAAASL